MAAKIALEITIIIPNWYYMILYGGSNFYVTAQVLWAGTRTTACSMLQYMPLIGRIFLVSKQLQTLNPKPLKPLNPNPFTPKTEP